MVRFQECTTKEKQVFHWRLGQPRTIIKGRGRGRLVRQTDSPTHLCRSCSGPIRPVVDQKENHSHTLHSRGIRSYEKEDYFDSDNVRIGGRGQKKDNNHPIWIQWTRAVVQKENHSPANTYPRGRRRGWYLLEKSLSQQWGNRPAEVP